MSGADGIPRKRTSSLGCLGCLALPTMGLVTAGLLGLIWWLNPMWLDQRAVWRAPLVSDGARVGHFASDDDEFLAQLGVDPAWAIVGEAETSRGLGQFDLERVVGAYDPWSGGEVRGADGLGLQVPAGALPEGGELSMTPVLDPPDEMRAYYAGLIYDIRLGDEEHLEFRRPVTLTLPIASNVDPEQVRLVVWQNGRWEPVPAEVNASERTITAKIEHASHWLAVSSLEVPPVAVAAAIAATLWAATNGTTRGAGKSVAWALADGFETPGGNFQFHYEMSAVPDDATYLAAVGSPRTGSPVPDVPLYIQDLGSWLEECRPGLESMGLSLPAAKLLRYDVFVSPIDALGLSGLGGPLVLSSDLHTKAAADGLPLADLMRSVCAHELVHVSQAGLVVLPAMAEEYLPAMIAPERRWWLEMTAEYLANYYWELQGRPLGIVAERYRKTPSLPNTTMVGSEDPTYYSYASMLSLIDEREGSGSAARWVQTFDGYWTGGVSQIDAAAREALGGRGLADLFREFAFDCFHDDLWRAQRFPKFHAGKSDMNQVVSQGTGHDIKGGMRFSMVARTAGKLTLDARSQSRSMDGLAPLTAQAAYLLFDGLKPEQHAKLVIHAVDTSPNGARPSLYLSVDDAQYQSQGNNPYMLPVTRELGKPKRVSLDGQDGFVHVVEDLGAPDGPNRATLIALNESLDGGAGSIYLERWLLLPPESLQYERRDSTWILDWSVVELAGDPKAFAAYRVYRKPRGSDDSLYELALEATEPHAIFTGQPERDYDFSVRVVDSLGNESADAKSLNLSFAGQWSGKLRLVKGEVLKPLLDWAERRIAELIEEAREEIRNTSDFERRDELRRDLDEDLENLRQLREEIRPYIDVWSKAEAALHAGTPVSFEIREKGSGYEMNVTSIMGFEIDKDEWVPLGKLGRDRIGVVDPGDLEDLREIRAKGGLNFSPLELRMHRYDPTGKRSAVIRTDEWNLSVPIEPDGQIDVQLAWEFTRKQ